MGKGSRARAKLRRQRERRSRAEAKRALYARYRDEGRAKGSHRAKKNASRYRSCFRVRDPNSKNIGDITVYTRLNMPSAAFFYALARATKTRYHGKHKSMIRAFVDSHNIRYQDGKLYDNNGMLTETQLQALVNMAYSN